MEKIKNYLSNKKLIAIFLFIVIVIGLAIPLSNAKADMFGITDAFQMILDAVEEQVGPFMTQLIKVFFGYIFGLIILYVSANLLQFAINGQVSWLTINNSALVQSGWRFVMGLTNLFLIIIFIIIAISYILRIETFQAKKALPKLIIVALLMNFSLVFIGILVDISNVLYRTILVGNDNLIIQFIDSFGAGTLSNLLQLGIWLGTLIVLWAIPFIGGFAQLAFVVLMLAISGPTVMTWIFQFVLFIMASGLFFTYTFLFAARVFVIQLLAILSPLAFLCMILPQTEKYWKEWLEHLLSWIMLGIILLFFISIGVRASGQLVPPGGYTPTPILGWGMLQSYFVYYFFVMIFFIIVLFVSKKFMPTLASFMVAQATAMAGMAYARVIKPVTAPLVKGLREGAGRAAESLRQRTGTPEMTAWAERQALATKGWGPGAIGKATGAFRRGMGRSMLRAGPEAEKNMADETEKEAEKESLEMVVSKLRSETRMSKKVGYINRIIKQGDIDDAFKKGLTEQEIVPIREAAEKYDKHKDIDSSLPHLRHARMQAIATATGKPVAEVYAQPIAGYSDSGVLGKIKPARAGQISENIFARTGNVHAQGTQEFEHADAMEGMLRSWDGRQVGKFIETHGRRGADAIEDRIKQAAHDAGRTPEQWLQDKNPRLLSYIRSSTGKQFFTL